MGTRHGEETQACRRLRVGGREHAGCRRGSLLARLTAIESQDASSALAKFQGDGHADNPRAGNDDVRSVHRFIVKALVESSLDDLVAAPSELSFGELGENHQPLRGRANVVGRVAGDEGELSVGGRLQHAQVVRFHDLFSGHVEAKTLGSATDDDLVTLIEFKEVSKEGIAVCGDY